MLSFIGRAVTAFAAITTAAKTQSTSQTPVSWNFQIPYQGAGVVTVCNNGSSPLVLDSVAWNGNTLGVSSAWGELFPYNAEFSSSSSGGLTTLNATFPDPVSIAPDNCATGTFTYTGIDPSTYFPIVLAPQNVSITTVGEAPQDVPVIGQISNSTYPFPGRQLNYYQGDWYGYYAGFSWPSASQDFNFHDRLIAFAENTAAGDVTYPDMDMLSKIIPAEQIKQLQLPGRDVYISEGGWSGSSNFAAIFSDPTIRSQHNQNIVSICQQLNVNWEWDWEYPGVSDAANFLAGIQDLAARLAAIGKKLSITLPGGPDRMDVLEQGCPGFFKALDAIPNLSKRVMTYDYGDGLWMTNMGSLSPLNDTAVDGPGNSWIGVYNYLLSKGTNIAANYEFGLPAYTRILPVMGMGAAHGNGEPLDPSRSPISQFPGQNDGTVDNLCVAQAMGEQYATCYDNPSFTLPSDMTYIPAGGAPDLVTDQTGLIYSPSSLYVGSIFDAQATASHINWALAKGVNRFFIWQRSSDAPIGSPLNIAGTAASILGNSTIPVPSMSPSPAPASASPSPVTPSLSASQTPTASASASASQSAGASSSATASPATGSESSGFSKTAEIGVVVGEGVAGLAAIAGAFYCLRRRYAKAEASDYRALLANHSLNDSRASY